jgi:hypothetical protein
MEMRRVPTSVMVVSILGILYSAMALLGVPCGILLFYLPLMPNTGLEALRQDGGYMAMTMISGAINFVLGGLLLASSIGSLKLRPWARMGMNVYGVVHICSTIAGSVISLVYVMPRVMAVVGKAGGPGMVGGQIGGMVGAAFGMLLGIGVGVVILVVFNRRVAVDALKGIFPVEPGNFPVEFPAAEEKR